MTSDRQNFDYALWRRIDAVDFNTLDGYAGRELGFTDRLARENGWNHAFARAVIEEYKRFLYLSVKAGHPVTPSDEVDQAWHLHLAYSRHYWKVLCPKVLKTDLHHGPTKGGNTEGRKFRRWYARTKNTYARIFGAAPPHHIWPSANHRFGHAPHFRRINTRDNWIMRKPKIGVGLGMGFAAAIGVLLVSGDARAADPLLRSDYFWVIAACFGFIAGVILLARGVRTQRIRRYAHRHKEDYPGLANAGFLALYLGYGMNEETRAAIDRIYDDPDFTGETGADGGDTGCGAGCGGCGGS